MSSPFLFAEEDGSASRTFPIVVTAAQGFGVVGGSTPPQ